MILIVVESPTKAKAIGEYLKGEKEKFHVLSTYGHIRNLVTKSGSIETDKEYKYHWKTTLQWDKHKKDVLSKAREADKIVIATDLDREGEGIAWHLLEMLKENKINKPTERIVFHSVEKSAILDALKHGQKLRTGLVESYLARIGLDYLFGFSISPLLWHKVPCCKSAGRVQSVALRLIVERESEIKDFKSQKYITIHAKYKECSQDALMVEFNGEKFENGQIFTQAIDLKKLDGKFVVRDIKTTQSKQNAPAPFITSTLLQAASSGLNFSPAMTMQLAQKLYEGFKIDNKHTGLITYMRTDSVHIEPSIITNIRNVIAKKFGAQYLPAKANMFKSSTKNAQEAHEAIRPVDLNIHPATLNIGDKNLEKLYQLIWERTIASQMNPAILETKTANIDGIHTNDKSVFELKATNILFQGFKAIFNDDEDEKLSHFDFSKIKEKAQLDCTEIFDKEHQTQPPRRFSEASLIQQSEKRGIGRPSTYPKILQVLYEREYATKEKKIIIPTQKGWIVTAFLKGFFPHEVAYEFTANLEEALDDLHQSNGNHIEILEKFWKHLETRITEVKDQAPSIISTKVREEFASYFLKDKQKCSNCAGHLVLKIGRFGAIVGCENYPNCKEILNIDQSEMPKEKQDLGQIDGSEVTLKNGPYGPYIECVAGEKIKRIPVPKIWQTGEELTQEQAQFLAQLPKEIGEYDNHKVSISIGRFGPFIKCGTTFVSIKDPMNITLDQAIIAIERKMKKVASGTTTRRPAKPAKIIKPAGKSIAKSATKSTPKRTATKAKITKK